MRSMMAIRVLVMAGLACGLAPALAWADSCPVDEECAIIPLRPGFDGAVQWHAYSAVAAQGRMSDTPGQAGSTLTAGFDLAYVEQSCTWLGAAGEIHRDASAGDSRYRGKQRVTACAPIPMIMPEVAIAVERELEPRLSAAPYLSASRVSGMDLGVRAPMFRIYDSTHEVRAGSYQLDIHWMNQIVDGMLVYIQDRTHSVSLIEGTWYGQGFAGRNGKVHVGRLEVKTRMTEQALDGQDYLHAVTWKLAPLAFEGARYEGFAYHLDLDAGLNVGMLHEPVEYKAGNEIKLEVLSPYVSLRLSRAMGDSAHGFGYERSLHPGSYGTLVGEDRLSGWLVHDKARVSTTLRGFAALTRMIDQQTEQEDGSREYVLTGGVAARVDTRLGPYLHLGLGSEVARSFFASLHQTSRVDARWAGRLTVDLTARMGSNQ
jgi:hypothetical protein